MEVSTQAVYFGQAGPVNTDRALELAYDRAQELGLRTILVASTTGETGLRAARLFQGFDLVVVSHATGFRAPDTQEMSSEQRARLEAAGARVLTCQHALGGVNRAIRRKFDTYQMDEIIAYTLRLMGQGMKVALEISLMAADAGMARTDGPLMSIGGSSGGADTAVVLLPVNAHDFFDLQVLEVVCRPAPSHPGFRMR